MPKSRPSDSEVPWTNILRRLDALISVILETTGREKPLNTKEKIYSLSHSGLSPLEIAKILGVPNNIIRARLVEIRRADRTLKGKK